MYESQYRVFFFRKDLQVRFVLPLRSYFTNSFFTKHQGFIKKNISIGGNRVLFYPFRSDDILKSLLKPNKKSQHNLQVHSGFITCLDISRDGQLSVSGSTDHLVNVWQLNSHELLLTLNGHTGPITSLHFSPNGLFVASGSEDKTVKVWGLTLGTLVATFKVSSQNILVLS